MAGGGEWAWTGNLSISRDAVSVAGRNGFQIPLHKVCYGQDGNKTVVAYENRDELFTTYKADNENSLAGMYLVKLLLEAEEMNRDGEPPVRRASR